jgi:hypothetical protein
MARGKKRYPARFLRFHTPSGWRFRDCAYHISGDTRWIAFPGKPQIDEDCHWKRLRHAAIPSPLQCRRNGSLHSTHRAAGKLRPIECDGGRQCWVRDGPPAYDAGPRSYGQCGGCHG